MKSKKEKAASAIGRPRDIRMKTICIISVCVIAMCMTIAPALFAADLFLSDKFDPAAAGMSTERLAKIAPRMKEFVDGGKAAGIVTLIARHGHIASLDAVGYQDLETKA